MADHLSIEQRHKNMASIHAKNTKPELIVRKYLWGHGFRYRLNYNRLPGKPDLVLRKYRTCIFINGCFWHGHNIQFCNTTRGSFNSHKDRLPFNMEVDSTPHTAIPQLENSLCCKIPKSNSTFWIKKILRNKERDIIVQKKLAAMGWHTITVWECELKSNKKDITLESLLYTLNHIFLQDHKAKAYEMPNEEEMQLMVAEENQIT